TDVLVTGRSTGNGFFVQIKSGDAAFAGVAHSGIFVAADSGLPTVGQRLTLTARVATSAGDVFLRNPLGTVTASGVAPPTPVIESSPGVPLTAADLALGGAQTDALQDVVVSLSNVTVTAVNPPHEFTVD